MPLPFVYESTGLETYFTNLLDPEPRARNVFAFHQPETLGDWLAAMPEPTVLTAGGPPANEAGFAPVTFLADVRRMPELITEWADFKLWPAQITAIRNLEGTDIKPVEMMVFMRHECHRSARHLAGRAVGTVLVGPLNPRQGSGVRGQAGQVRTAAGWRTAED
ncbi:MAG TPA: hypothetical protein VFC14_21885 [Burkholderiales bacterium]|nr:hypothetical protein [Burkholderiales bacterium]